MKKGAGRPETTDITIGLVGNANVGKSLIFNQLTGGNQTTGNWPGKTVERVEGTLLHHGLRIKLLDLPGTYSMTPFSDEELVTREQLLKDPPDVLMDVVDSTALERNLFFTLQLIEMGLPVVVALNQMDLVRKKGLKIDAALLEELLGVPVVPMSALKGEGVHQAVDRAIDLARSRGAGTVPSKVRYSRSMEGRIESMQVMLEGNGLGLPPRWAAIKVLEGDPDLLNKLRNLSDDVLKAAASHRKGIRKDTGQNAATALASERYLIASTISAKAVSQEGKRVEVADRLDSVFMHPIMGYVVLLLIALLMIASISFIGGMVSSWIEEAFLMFRPDEVTPLEQLLWDGAVLGLSGALGVLLGFILPFYILLGLLEDSGFLPRAAFLMDRPFHAVGLHGKAALPILMGFGCSVPACLGARIMENDRDRFITAFLATMVPCSARIVVIIGLVGVYLGVEYALLIYLIDLLLVVIVGKVLNRLVPGRSPGLIMEIPPYKSPNLGHIFRQTWYRMKGFVTTAIPLIMVGSILIVGSDIVGILDRAEWLLEPVTVWWLGLPAFTGILLIFGILRKEAALVLLASTAGLTSLSEISSVMTDVQMFTFTLVVTLYIPCIATVGVLAREFGWKRALIVTFSEVLMALLIGGLAGRVMDPFI